MAFTVLPTGILRPLAIGEAVAIITTQNEFFAIMDSDLDNAFFNQNEFAEKAKIKYTHENGQIETYKAIFDDPTTSLNIQSGIDVTLLRPQVQIPEKRLVNPPSKKDKLVIRGLRYTVENHISDGVGVVTIFLSRR